MTEPRHLKHAPITEAIIDIRIQPAIETLDVLNITSEDFRKRYPKQEAVTHGTLGLQFGHEQRVSFENREVGYKYSSEDGKNIAQFRKDGLGFSHLAPYDSWKKMAAEAKAVWDLYYEAAKPSVIPRIATRFINTINLPLPVEELSEFFTTPPQVPPELPQEMGSFISRINISADTFQGYATITQAYEKPEEKFAPILLDIDTVCDKRYNASDKEAYWNCLNNQLHDFKNRAFFSSITETTAEMFE